jgi:hypothetical protein
MDMPASFWLISSLVFITITFLTVPVTIRYYRKELGREWDRQRWLNIATLLRGAIPLCVLLTAVIIVGVRFVFY